MKISFVADPMCSWCWGFEPELEKLRTSYHDSFQFDIVMGGLREDIPWDESSKNYLKEHWESVAKKTNQPFNNSFFKQSHFTYNTFPSCKAVVTVRSLEHDKAFAYFHALQEAFYKDARDITRKEALADIASECEVDREKFLTFFQSDEAEKLMREDFQKARMLGANSFPSIIMIDDEGHLVTLKGYRTFEELSSYLHR